ncbi:24835_t:CDS:2 [Gigaspora margarita]|uniref:24835_t:CDS:1 n=1 Tax=Gigaspora margarita TaxID=4874 RepID=A0ABN7UGL1_GIGMA|nr:24835_t:CDS:2 [Gigaspora margarita]
MESDREEPILNKRKLKQYLKSMEDVNPEVKSNGIGIKSNIKKAYKWYLTAVNENNLTAVNENNLKASSEKFSPVKA